MDGKKVDPRVARTRGALMQALMELIVEKGFDKTTVQDILARANVARSTFYEHFASKEDLLLGDWTLFQLELPEQDPSSPGPPRLPDVTHVFRHAGENHALYRSLVASGQAEGILQLGQRDLETSLERQLAALERCGLRLPVPSAAAARYVGGGLIALLRHWLDGGMRESPEEMNARFLQLAGSGLSADSGGL